MFLQIISKDGFKVTLNYKSYADYSAGGEIEFKNNANFWDVNAYASFKTKKDIKSSIVKTDGNNNTANTYVKTTDVGYDGTLTWIVKVTMDKKQPNIQSLIICLRASAYKMLLYSYNIIIQTRVLHTLHWMARATR